MLIAFIVSSLTMFGLAVWCLLLTRRSLKLQAKLLDATLGIEHHSSVTAEVSDAMLMQLEEANIMNQENNDYGPQEIRVVW